MRIIPAILTESLPSFKPDLCTRASMGTTGILLATSASSTPFAVAGLAFMFFGSNVINARNYHIPSKDQAIFKEDLTVFAGIGFSGLLLAKCASTTLLATSGVGLLFFGIYFGGSAIAMYSKSN
jgi:hypothetical protein